MTIGLKNDSGKDIQALYYKFYILDLVEPHSDISSPLFMYNINSPHLFKSGLVQDIEFKTDFTEQKGRSIKEVMK